MIRTPGLGSVELWFEPGNDDRPGAGSSVTEVVVRKLKFDGSVKYQWPGELVETPGNEWAVVYHDPVRHEKRPDSAPEDEPAAHMLHYVGLAGPVSVLFAFSMEGAFLEAKCDAALPGTIRGSVIDFVDLDLDVVVLPGGTHYIRDQEVFAQRSRSMGYSDEAKRQAHLGILKSLRMIRRGQFPFDGHADGLVKRFIAGEPGQGPA